MCFLRVTESYIQYIKTYFPWRKWRKSIHCVRNVLPFQGWWLFKTECKIIYLKWRCLAVRKHLCHILFMCCLLHLWVEIVHLTKRCKTLNVSHGHRVCWRQHLLCMIMKWKTIFHSGLDSCLPCNLPRSVEFLGILFRWCVVGYESEVQKCCAWL